MFMRQTNHSALQRAFHMGFLLLSFLACLYRSGPELRPTHWIRIQSGSGSETLQENSSINTLLCWFLHLSLEVGKICQDWTVDKSWTAAAVWIVRVIYAAFCAFSGSKICPPGTLKMVTRNNVAIRIVFKKQAEPPQWPTQKLSNPWSEHSKSIF